MLSEAPWRLVKSLVAKKARQDTGMTVAEGPPSVTSALESGVAIEYFIMSESFSSSSAGLSVERLSRASGVSRNIFVVPDALFDRMSETRSPQGVLCVVRVPFTFESGGPVSSWQKSLELVCVDIQDPGNAGTLIRAASAVGASRVVFAGASVDPFSPKCIRSSAGTVFTVKVDVIDQEKDPATFVAGLAAGGLSVFKAVPQGGAAPWDTDFCGPSAIVVGNEANGLREEILSGPGTRISIPMPGGTESLNVAIASGMVLYEALSQRMKPA